MSGMGEIPMPGGGALSMAWLPVCGQTWPGTAASFIGMWAVMMVAMMLPSLAPMLWRYRQALGAHGHAHPGTLTALLTVAGAAYFCVWIALGAAIFALGAALAETAMKIPAVARALPLASGMAVLLGGLFQFTASKTRSLACCRGQVEQHQAFAAGTGAAWQHGLRLGLHCSRSCAGLTVILLVMGVMDLGAMALVTAATTAERIVPAGERIALAVGVIATGAGWFMVARASGVL